MMTRRQVLAAAGSGCTRCFLTPRNEVLSVMRRESSDNDVPSVTLTGALFLCFCHELGGGSGEGRRQHIRVSTHQVSALVGIFSRTVAGCVQNPSVQGYSINFTTA